MRNKMLALLASAWLMVGCANAQEPQPAAPQDTVQALVEYTDCGTPVAIQFLGRDKFVIVLPRMAQWAHAVEFFKIEVEEREIATFVVELHNDNCKKA
jgi:hypothetical protein